MLRRVRPLAVCFLFAFGAAGCRGCGHRSSTELTQIGALASVDAVDMAPYFAAAHAIITKKPVPAPPTSHAAQRVFVTWWSVGHLAVRASAIGPTLFDSVRLASEEIAKTASGEGRVEIEIITEAEAASVAGDEKMAADRMGLFGYVAFDETHPVGWVSPTETIMDKLVDARDEHPIRLKVQDIDKLLAARAKVSVADVKKMTILRVSVNAQVEGAEPGKPPIPLLRSMPHHPTNLSADDIFAAVRGAASYIARTCDAQGRFIYSYNPVTNESPNGYGYIRHAGAVYALMEAYGELKDESWKAAGDRAIANLIQNMKSAPSGLYVQDTIGEEQQKVGGAGLALVALAKYTEVTGDRKHLATMRSLADFILHQQYPDGHFRANVDVQKEEPNTDPKSFRKEVTYYPGEAVLGLIRLQGIDPNPKWLDGAKKGADFIIDIRDAKADEKHQIHDHWMSYALLDLYRATNDKRYADHAFKIGRAILLAEVREGKASSPDYVGSFFDKAPTTPASTRLEALAAHIQLERVMGGDEAWLRGPAMEVACFMRGQQIDEDSAYFAEIPEKAKGGVRESVLSSEVRIDYPQHALSGWLRFARELRDPTWK